MNSDGNTFGSIGTPRKPERMNDEKEALLNDFDFDFEMDEDSFID